MLNALVDYVWKFIFSCFKVYANLDLVSFWNIDSNMVMDVSLVHKCWKHNDRSADHNMQVDPQIYYHTAQANMRHPKANIQLQQPGSFLEASVRDRNSPVQKRNLQPEYICLSVHN